MRKLLPVIQFSHQLVATKLQSGGHAVDATAGNGNDSLFMLNHMKKNAHLYIFDIQEQALNNTKEKIIHKFGTQEIINANRKIHFLCTGHENLKRHVHSKVKVIMFNLGYLPGSDVSIITKPNTTLEAIESGLELLETSGLISVVLYPGHDGGDKEANLVSEYVTKLNSYDYGVILYKQMNKEKSPFFIGIEKKR
ncbi:16S rRNA (cytosine(1402)-N(4))-methyltransferase [Desulfuribacillus stibiiarsenatis]|uniref:16S rRNA (Cytosine(1402)-N(4))-methyltransferase n=1 Tax=Desulfuribacillus stibiiarsenatis TaxID=1390249 RepID=A0A1E5L3W7_9FIRM|nr:class I SAM-dependent methyltransferase [Desulfuribacillus stibiiarsenatis]OEH84786.1 16S rRNA (cytosine(1402)-N(4))-methyltransferase [Desulfuribacillus stibiiarsenatis]